MPVLVNTRDLAVGGDTHCQFLSEMHPREAECGNQPAKPPQQIVLMEWCLLSRVFVEIFKVEPVCRSLEQEGSHLCVFSFRFSCLEGVHVPTPMGPL